jgi:hypothetical protein
MVVVDLTHFRKETLRGDKVAVPKTVVTKTIYRR